jgi:hypothetical protein
MSNLAPVVRPPVPLSVQEAIAAAQQRNAYALAPQLSQQGIAHILQQQRIPQQPQQQQPQQQQPQQMTPEATQFLLARQQAGFTPVAAQPAQVSAAKVMP